MRNFIVYLFVILFSSITLLEAFDVETAGPEALKKQLSKLHRIKSENSSRKVHPTERLSLDQRTLALESLMRSQDQNARYENIRLFNEGLKNRNALRELRKIELKRLNSTPLFKLLRPPHSKKGLVKVEDDMINVCGTRGYIANLRLPILNELLGLSLTFQLEVKSKREMSFVYEENYRTIESNHTSGKGDWETLELKVVHNGFGCAIFPKIEKLWFHDKEQKFTFSLGNLKVFAER